MPPHGNIRRIHIPRFSVRQFALLLAAAIVVVTVQQYARHGYNNYSIFAGSLKVLLAHQSLYVPHPEYHSDLYKYSPTFPLFMAPFTWQPVLTGLLCWNLMNGFALFAAIRALWPDDDRRVVVALGLVSIELVTSLQSAQSNALVAALIVLTFVQLEREQSWRAGFSIAAGFFLKGYGAAAGLLALLYPKRVRAMGATLAWIAALAAVPLLVLSADELLSQYAQWANVRDTFDPGRKASVMRVWARYVDPDVNPLVIQLVGGLFLLLPFARARAWRDPLFRQRLLCSVLVALVIFNDAAEPPTYIVAMTGCAIWYLSDSARSRMDRVVALTIMFGVSLISTDLYPRSLRGTLMGPYTAKAMGCLILWIWMNWELLRFKSDSPAPDSQLATNDQFPTPT
jgi:hypothetical protein